MVNVTLFELHLEDASFTANAPFSGRTDSDQDGTSVVAGDGHVTSESERGSSLLAAVIGLVFLVAVAFVVRRVVTRGDDEPGGAIELDDIEA